MRRAIDRLTAAELREIDDLEWRIASLDYDLRRLQNRDEYEAAETADGASSLLLP